MKVLLTLITLILIIGLSFPCYSGDWDMNTYIDFSNEALADISSIAFTNSVADSVTFYLSDDEELTFYWSDGQFHIEYPEGKLDESGKVFVEWIEQYMRDDYCKDK